MHQASSFRSYIVCLVVADSGYRPHLPFFLSDNIKFSCCDVVLLAMFTSDNEQLNEFGPCTHNIHSIYTYTYIFTNVSMCMLVGWMVVFCALRCHLNFRDRIHRINFLLNPYALIKIILNDLLIRCCALHVLTESLSVQCSCILNVGGLAYMMANETPSYECTIYNIILIIAKFILL